MTRNASQRKDIRIYEKFAKEAETARINFIIAAMSTSQGRTWFHNLLAACSIFDGSFSNEALLEAFTKGQRNIGLMIYNDIVTHCPDYFVLMMREATIQEQTNVRRTESASDPDLDLDPGDELSGSPDADG